MLEYFLIGAFAGAVTGIPIGPVNVAVINCAYRHNLRRAIAVALGGALADGFYALFGIVGVGPLIESRAIIKPILFVFSGVALLIYGALTVRAQPVDPVKTEAQQPQSPKKHWWSGFALGVALIVLNPAALVTWVVIVGTHLSGASRLEGTFAAIGVSAGSFLWFSLVAYLSHHGTKFLGDKAVWVTRGVGIGLLGYGGYLIVRAITLFSRL